jgi:hypothetical protein
MLVTLIMSLAATVASATGVFRTETLPIAAAFGTSFGFVWFCMMGMLMKRASLWGMASVALVAIHFGTIVGIGIISRQGPDDTIWTLGPLTLGLYLQGLMYLVVLRTADYRLANRWHKDRQ